MEMIEVTANSVDAAISKGLAELKATAGDVMIEVLEEPNTGLFGFGAREARVRIVLIGRRKSEEREEYVEDDPAEPEQRERPELPAVPEDELDEDAIVGRQVLVELLEKMQIEAKVNVHRADDDDGDDPHWMLNVNGKRNKPANRAPRRNALLFAACRASNLQSAAGTARECHRGCGGLQDRPVQAIAWFGAAHGQAGGTARTDDYA